MLQERSDRWIVQYVTVLLFFAYPHLDLVVHVEQFSWAAAHLRKAFIFPIQEMHLSWNGNQRATKATTDH